MNRDYKLFVKHIDEFYSINDPETESRENPGFNHELFKRLCEVEPRFQHLVVSIARFKTPGDLREFVGKYAKYISSRSYRKTLKISSVDAIEAIAESGGEWARSEVYNSVDMRWRHFELEEFRRLMRFCRRPNCRISATMASHSKAAHFAACVPPEGLGGAEIGVYYGTPEQIRETVAVVEANGGVLASHSVNFWAKQRWCDVVSEHWNKVAIAGLDFAVVADSNPEVGRALASRCRRAAFAILRALTDAVYRPGGPGYAQAKARFEALAAARSPAE